MLSDDLLQLLTAYVDGELSQRQRKAVRRLLERSSEARVVLTQLEDNARKVRRLPQRKVVPSLAPDVLQVITEEGLHITRPPVPLVRHPWRPVAATLVAASLLLAAVGGLVYFSGEPLQVAPKGSGPVVVAPTPPPKRAPDRETPPVARKGSNPLINQLVEGTFQSAATPIPVEPEPVFSVAFRELQKEPVAGRLSSQIEKDRAVQLDIVVKNNAVALERLQSTLHDHGIKVVLDPQVKKNGGKAEYVVFTENLRTDEVTAMLRELSRDDNRLQQNARTPFEKVTVTPLTAKEKKQVSALLGVEPGKLDARAEAKNAEFKRWERSAVILPPNQAARPSREVQTFVNQRRPQTGTVQVLLRIRQEK